MDHRGSFGGIRRAGREKYLLTALPKPGMISRLQAVVGHLLGPCVALNSARMAENVDNREEKLSQCT